MPPDESIAKAGAALMATALVMIIVQGVVLRFLTWKPERLLCTGVLLGALAMLLGIFARSYLEIFGALVLFGAALGLMLPGNLASLSLRAGGEAQGKAAGVNAIGQGLGLAIGPVAGASLHHVAPEAPFAVAATLLAVAFCLALVASRSRARAILAQ
jgi:predicted MFS family arabinose efflux permease